MNDEDRAKLSRKLQKDVDDFISNLKPKKYEDGWPEDKWEEEIEKHPFFMTKPPVEGQELDPSVEALQQLKYDPEFNSSNELAVSYKEDGNQNFKREKYRWAVECYTNGLDAKAEDNQLNVILYTNRAAAQYHIGNYRKALIDATEAKTLNPHHLKAIHRGAMCCLELREYDNCISWSDEGLRLNAEDKVLKDLKEEAEKEKEKVEIAKEKAAEEKLEIESLNRAIRERGIQLEGNGLTAESLQPIHNSKVHLTREGSLVWPVILHYPEFNDSDFIQAFHEESCFYEELIEMFRESPEWDTKREYGAESIQIYFTGSNDTLVPVNKNKSLKSVMRDKRFILKVGAPTFIATVANSAFDVSYKSGKC